MDLATSAYEIIRGMKWTVFLTNYVFLGVFFFFHKYNWDILNIWKNEKLCNILGGHPGVCGFASCEDGNNLKP